MLRTSKAICRHGNGSNNNKTITCNHMRRTTNRHLFSKTAVVRSKYVDAVPKSVIQSTRQLEEILKQHERNNPRSIFLFENAVERVGLKTKAVSLLQQKIQDLEDKRPHNEGGEKYGVYLTGPLGSGKTQLLDDIAEQCLAEGWAVVRLPELSKWTMDEFSSPSDACKFFIWYMKEQFRSSGRKFHKTDALPTWWHQILTNSENHNDATVVKLFFKQLEQYDTHRLLIICDDFHNLFSKYPIARPGVVTNNYMGIYPFIELIFPMTRYKRAAILLAGESTTESIKNSVVGSREKYSYLSVGKLEDHEWTQLFAQNDKNSKLLCVNENESKIKYLSNGILGEIVGIGDKIINKQNENVPLPNIMKNIFSKVSHQNIGTYWFEPNQELVKTVLQDYENEMTSRFTSYLENALLTEFPDATRKSVKSFWATRNEFMRGKTKFFENLFTYLVPLYNPDTLLRDVSRKHEGEDALPESKVFKNSSMEKILLKGGFIFINEKGNYEPRNPIAYKILFNAMVNSLYKLKFNYNAQRTTDLNYLDTPKEMYSRKKAAVIRELARKVLELNTDPSVYATSDLLQQLYTECKASANFHTEVTLTPVSTGSYTKDQFAFITPEQQAERDKNIASLLFGEMEEMGEPREGADIQESDRFKLFQDKFDGALPRTLFEDLQNLPVVLNQPIPFTSISARSLDHSKRVKINLLKDHKEFNPREKMTTPVTIYHLHKEDTVTSYLSTIPESTDDLLDVRLIVPYSTRTKGDIDLIIGWRKNASGRKWNTISFKVVDTEANSQFNKRQVTISERYQQDLALSTNGQEIYENGHLVFLTFEEKPVLAEDAFRPFVEIEVTSPSLNQRNVWVSYMEDYLKDEWTNIKQYFPEIARRRRQMLEDYKRESQDNPDESLVEQALEKFSRRQSIGENDFSSDL